MIKFIKNISLFSFITTVGYIILIILWGELMPSFLRPNLSDSDVLDDNILLTLKDLNDAENIDVLFLGSSHTYRTFDPRIWEKEGFKTFNLGSSAQTHIHTGLLLNRYLDQLNPKLIVYEVYPDIFANDGIESNSVFLNYDICYDQMRRVVFDSRSIKSLNEYIFATYRNWFYEKKEPIFSMNNIEQEYISNGFVERKSNKFDDTPSHKRNSILKSQLRAFESNIQLMEESNIIYVLVRAPVTEIEVDRFPDLEIYNKWMSKYEHFLDYSHSEKLKDSIHFYDYHHLNQEGVEIFNPIFIDTLLQMNLLKNSQF